MAMLPEPDDVDLVVSSGDPDPKSLQDTIDYINDLRRRADHPAAVREAKEILDQLGIDPGHHGMDDPAALLDHWRQCVEDLARGDPKGSSARSA